MCGEIGCILFAFVVQVSKGIGGIYATGHTVVVVDGQVEAVLGHQLLGPPFRESPTRVFMSQFISRSLVESVFPLACEILFQI